MQRQDQYKKPINILFLCTGNSCRSQMAEGWARHLGGAGFEILSAGIEAHGKNPRAIAVMDAVDIDISHQESTRIDDEMLSKTDVVITVCTHADEYCPKLTEGTIKEHWPLSDPAKAIGSEEEIMRAFAASRDNIRERVTRLLERLRSPASVA